MYPDIKELIEILISQKLVSEEDCNSTELAAEDSQEFVYHLLTNDLITAEALGKALATKHGTQFMNLEQQSPSPEIIRQIPVKVARENRLILVRNDNGSVDLASDKPDDKGVKNTVYNLFKGMRTTVYYAFPEDIDAQLQCYDAPLDTRFNEIIAGSKKIAPEILAAVIKDAIRFKTSDVHFEPQLKGDVLIRFRIDGSLRRAGSMPMEQYEKVLNLIKMESGMRIDEHYNAQDGSMHTDTGPDGVDLRVSLIPTVQGEKIVMRVMRALSHGFGLGKIGLSPDNLQQIRNFSKKPYGMMIVAGPTGSGKTTTLYTALKLVNRPDLNVTTIEDPVEVQLPGINQIEVKERIGLTFSKGLRSIVRQDPDVILVGEIRDEETAVISVNAALTGHLLLTTFHANDAATAIPRLLNMGVEPFLLSSTLEIVAAQRLVRIICEQCKTSMTAVEAAKTWSLATSVRKFFSPNDALYYGTGCMSCNNTGYRGRTAIFEFIAVTPDLQELILHNPSAQQIAATARKNGSLSMFEDGILKVKDGITTIEEVLRTAEVPET